MFGRITHKQYLSFLIFTPKTPSLPPDEPRLGVELTCPGYGNKKCLKYNTGNYTNINN